MNNSIEDFGTTWYIGKNPQERAFCEGEKLGHTFYCHIDVSNGVDFSSKGFGSYKDIKTFWKLTKDIPAEEKAIYEIIRDSGHSKFYADLEWSLDWKSKDEILEAFKDVITSGLQHIDYNIDFDEMKVLDACNEVKNKGSLHITHPDVYFQCLADQRRFWTNIKKIMEEDHPKLFFQEETESNYITKTFIDFAVYTKNRAFRLPFSSKMKNHKFERPLIPSETITKHNIGDYIISSPMGSDSSIIDVSLLPINTDILGKRNMVSKKIAENLASKMGVKLGQIKGNLITLKNIGTRICAISGESNESDNSYFSIKNGKVYYRCFDENCRKKTKCIYHIENDELQDDIPFDDYNKILNDALEQYQVLFNHQSINEESKKGYSERVEKSSQNYYTIRNQCLENINNYICVITGSSKPYFLMRKVGIDDINNKYIYYVRQLKGALLDTFQNKFYPDLFTQNKKGGLVRGKNKSWIELWLDWDKRKTFDQEMYQSPDAPCSIKQYNTFHNFNITPSLAIEKSTDGGVDKFLNFIKVAWANGNPEIYNWILNWFAHLVQKPLTKMNSALVLRGEEGIGKGMVLQKIKQIIGSQNFCQPTTPNDILGNFNSIVDRKAFLFLDELVWGGDKEKAGILKKIITEKEGTINEKNLPQRKFINCYNVAIATNEDWAVPAGNNARRYMMLDVINTDINKEDVYNCCPYSLAKFLYERDITGFQHDKIIVTQALASQKELSAPNAIKFILEQVKMETFPVDQKMEIESLYALFKNVYTTDRYTTVQLFGKQVKKVLDYKIYKPFKGKRQMVIPNIDECKRMINDYFKQDMFTGDIDIDVITETEIEYDQRSNEHKSHINPLIH
jgi:hypothetical protein